MKSSPEVEHGRERLLENLSRAEPEWHYKCSLAF
jgi:hypothetical protein